MLYGSGVGVMERKNSPIFSPCCPAQSIFLTVLSPYRSLMRSKCSASYLLILFP